MRQNGVRYHKNMDPEALAEQARLLAIDTLEATYPVIPQDRDLIYHLALRIVTRSTMPQKTREQTISVLHRAFLQSDLLQHVFRKRPR